MRTRNHDQDHEQPEVEPTAQPAETTPASEAAPPTLEERVAKLEAQMARVAALVGE